MQCNAGKSPFPLPIHCLDLQRHSIFFSVSGDSAAAPKGVVSHRIGEICLFNTSVHLSMYPPSARCLFVPLTGVHPPPPPFGTFPQNDVIQWRCSFSPPRLRVRLPLPQRRKKKGVVKRRPTSIGLEFSEMRQSLAADWPTALSDVRNGGLRLAESLSFPPFLFFAAAVLTKSFALFSRFSGKSLFFSTSLSYRRFRGPTGGSTDIVRENTTSFSYAIGFL